MSRQVRDTALWYEVQISIRAQVIAVAVLVACGFCATCGRAAVVVKAEAVWEIAEKYAESIEREGSGRPRVGTVDVGRRRRR